MKIKGDETNGKEGLRTQKRNYERERATGKNK
jgi:hypothetical protein